MVSGCWGAVLGRSDCVLLGLHLYDRGRVRLGFMSSDGVEVACD